MQEQAAGSAPSTTPSATASGEGLRAMRAPMRPDGRAAPSAVYPSRMDPAGSGRGRCSRRSLVATMASPHPRPTLVQRMRRRSVTRRDGGARPAWAWQTPGSSPRRGGRVPRGRFRRRAAAFRAPRGDVHLQPSHWGSGPGRAYPPPGTPSPSPRARPATPACTRAAAASDASARRQFGSIPALAARPGSSNRLELSQPARLRHPPGARPRAR
jgi:hypothetical protein